MGANLEQSGSGVLFEVLLFCLFVVLIVISVELYAPVFICAYMTCIVVMKDFDDGLGLN